VWNTSSFKVNDTSSDIIDTITQTDLNDYVSWSGITNVSNSNATNCELSCMTESKCVGYKWDIDSGMCTLYSKMVMSSTPIGNEVISWACNSGPVGGAECDWNSVLFDESLYNNNDVSKLEFRPDPSCPSFYNCNGELVPGQ